MIGYKNWERKYKEKEVKVGKKEKEQVSKLGKRKKMSKEWRGCIFFLLCYWSGGKEKELGRNGKKRKKCV